MLEHATLVVHGWAQVTLADGTRAWARSIVDGGARPLGFVRLAGGPRGSWFAWLRRARLDVYETDDASHVMSLTRSWGMLRIWEIDDAEDRHIGSVHAKSIASSAGERLGHLDRHGAQGRILDPTGRELAHFGKKNTDGLELTFAADAMANPFLRMLILGYVLVLDPSPK